MNTTTTLAAIVTLLATPTLALAETSVEFCKSSYSETGRYLPGFGEVTLEGPSLTVGEGSEAWTVPHDTVIIEFEDRVVKLTSKDTHPGSLADYIGTTMVYRLDGHEPFAVITDEEDGHRLALIQPGSIEGEYYCFSTVVR